MQLSKSFLSRPPSTRTSSGSTAPRANIPRFAIDPQMEIAAESDADRIERVNLACIQCRARHVKCDASQPVCNRCKRDRKECIYKKSRRGGLDKAALARRKLRLQQEAERTQKEQDGTLSEQSVNDAQCHQPNIISSLLDESALPEIPVDLSDSLLIPNIETQYPNSDLAFHVDSVRLLELYFENFWPSLPIILPVHHLQWRLSNDGHGMETLLLVLQYIGAVYAPWIRLGPGPYKKTAIQALKSPFLAHTPFNVQALLLFAIAEYHSDCKPEGQGQLNLAVKIALELHMNQQAFAQVYGEGSPVLEESWRRTYYFLAIADQNFAVFSNTPIYTLANVSNTVDLPCDDEHLNSGLIPPVMSLHDHEDRELAELEIVFSSIAYFYDLHLIVKSVMDMFVDTGTFGEAMIEVHDTKLAIWTSLLPACKKDPLRRDGTIDEVMFAAHMAATIALSGLHRSFSNLAICDEEIATNSFLPMVLFVTPPQQVRAAHTARVLKASEMHTKLLAIPCTMERHNVFTMYMVARLATTQTSTCRYLLEDRALAIARDRIRLSIGFLNSMGSVWPLGKMMAKEVSHIARINLSKSHSTVAQVPDSTLETDVPRDDLIFPVNPSAQIDIFSGLTLPIDWETTNRSYASSGPFGIS
ncbi:hypothetical protein HBI06_161980 [Parastagonospora nodorum]|nr:hypothetical protein HBI06_161980 [Parastagonospora nodorum]KAH4247793.1 hypothetical protein HBI05_032100 [Parastagonospora nodorum]